jgi:hypothetical protein
MQVLDAREHIRPVPVSNAGPREVPWGHSTALIMHEIQSFLHNIDC